METSSVTAMSLTCAREELAQKVQLVGRAVSTRASVQILGGVQLRAEAGRLELAATDMELSLRDWLGADVDGEGVAVVPGRLLIEIVRLLPPGEVTLAYEPHERTVRLNCGSSAYQLHTYDPEDFPRLPEIDQEETFAVDCKAFLETVSRVSRSASRDESRPVLTGILVRLEGGKLTMAATDSYRLSVKETALGADTGRELDAIVPARALGELVRVAQGAGDSELRMGIRENQVVFTVAGVWLTARRIDGQFPNYRQLLPESFEAEVDLPREEVLDAVRRVGVMAQRNTALRLRFEEGELTISARTQDIGEAQETLPVPYHGDVLEIGFNPEFLRDGLESVTTSEVRLKLINALRPGLLTAEGDDFWYLIMPIRLAGG